MSFGATDTRDDTSNDTIDGALAAPIPARSRRLGVVFAVLAGACATTWIAWWALHLDAGPVPIAVVVLDVVGLIAGLGVALGFLGDRADVATGVATDVAADVAAEFRYRDAVAGGRDATPWSVAVDGPRRVAQVAGLALALLLGASAPLPPGWVLAVFVVGLVAMSWSHHSLSDGVIRPGDRTRWAFASMGEVLAGDSRRHDRELARRRWTGVVGAIVVLCLAIALRGISDRWTHGLAAMDGSDRVVLLSAGLVLVLGALATLRRMGEPEEPNPHLVARRLDERTARQPVLVCAVVLGVTGLLAGVLPGHVDPADDDVPGVEQVTDRDPVGRARAGG